MRSGRRTGKVQYCLQRSPDGKDQLKCFPLEHKVDFSTGFFAPICRQTAVRMFGQRIVALARYRALIEKERKETGQ